MALLSLSELNNKIGALRNQYNAVPHIDEILNKDEQQAAKSWFQKWNQFYIEYQDKAGDINQATLENLNNKYNQQKQIIDKYTQAGQFIESQKQAETSQLGQQVLTTQEQIDEEERLRYEQQKKSAESKKTEVKATSYGTGNYTDLAKSWNALINLWDRIETLPAANVVTTVNNSINAWLDFYADQVEYYNTLGQQIPDAVQSQRSKWVDRYNKTRKVVEQSAAQSNVLADIPKATKQLGAENIKLGPGEVYDPATGQVIGAEQLITGLVAKPGVQPAPVPMGVLPSPWIPPPEPAYKPPPTIIIKQCYPPVQPTEPSIDPNEPLIFEPSYNQYGLGDIPGGGLVEPRASDDIDDPFEAIQQKVSSGWPWLVGIGVVIFLAKAWR